MALPSIIAPSGDNELLSLCRIYMFVTMAALLTGQSFIASAASLLAFYTLLQDSSSYESFNSSRRLDATLLDRWFFLCGISALVSVMSWFLISASTWQKDPDQAYKTFFFGFSIQKLWAILVGRILIEDFRLTFGKILPAAFQRRSKPGEKRNRQHSNDDHAPKDRRLFQRQRVSSALALVWHELRVRIVQGRNLTPMDHAFFFFGKMITSDPYVQVLLGQKSFGSTPYIPKTLNPVFPKNRSSFRMAVLPKSLQIFQHVECRIFDYDASSKDDAMGTVLVPIPEERNTPVRGWYGVGKGKGDTFCKGASGELLVEIEVVCP